MGQGWWAQQKKILLGRLLMWSRLNISLWWTNLLGWLGRPLNFSICQKVFSLVQLLCALSWDNHVWLGGRQHPVTCTTSYVASGLQQDVPHCGKFKLWCFVLKLCSQACAVLVGLLYCFFPFLFYTLKKNLVLINLRNGPPYQCVLALCAFLTGAVLKGLILRKFCVWCLCMLSFMGVCVRTDFVVFREFVVWWFVWSVNRR